MEPPRFSLRTAIRLTTALGTKRSGSIMKPVLLRLLIFLLPPRRCLLGFFEPHVFANRRVDAKVGVTQSFFQKEQSPMVKKMLLAIIVSVVFCTTVISARQLRTPAALGACHGTCSLTVTCFGTCFCYKGFCVSELPPQERSNKK
jgi:hypothetical protein